MSFQYGGFTPSNIRSEKDIIAFWIKDHFRTIPKVYLPLENKDKIINDLIENIHNDIHKPYNVLGTPDLTLTIAQNILDFLAKENILRYLFDVEISDHTELISRFKISHGYILTDLKDMINNMALDLDKLEIDQND